MDSRALMYSIIIGVIVLGVGSFYIFTATNLNRLSGQVELQRQAIQPTPQVNFETIKQMGIFDRSEFFDLPIDVLELNLGKQDPFAN